MIHVLSQVPNDRRVASPTVKARVVSAQVSNGRPVELWGLLRSSLTLYNREYYRYRVVREACGGSKLLRRVPRAVRMMDLYARSTTRHLQLTLWETPELKTDH